MTPDESLTVAANGEGSTVAGATPLPRRGLFDRDWQKVLIIELAILAGLALLWVVWQIISPLLHTIMLFALGAVLAFALTVPSTSWHPASAIVSLPSRWSMCWWLWSSSGG